ncbi:hypothetical protein F4780DRAFT_203936 [Xylariomycetidae sp. FL0641]|nr:hypothetical protein F4780DRAFT_203936 [Xylariomycetidae sp. FL0641]
MNASPSPRMPSGGRPLVRHPALLMATMVAGSLGAVAVYRRSMLRANELRQRNDSPNFYVSVERSGGGI